MHLLNRLLSLLMVTFAIGCSLAQQDGNIYIDSRFSESQNKAIRLAIDEWNVLSRSCNGKDILTYKGERDINRGFVNTDFNDNVHTIWTVWTGSKEYKEILESNAVFASYSVDIGLAGYATTTQVLLFSEEENHYSYIEDELTFIIVVVHELGHYLYIQHIFTGPNTVMYGGTKDYDILTSHVNQYGWQEGKINVLTGDDIEAYKLMYGCPLQQ